MINLRDNILKNQIAYYNGLIAKHQQNVEIYLNQPVGIGEHSDVMGTIDGEIVTEQCLTQYFNIFVTDCHLSV